MGTKLTTIMCLSTLVVASSCSDDKAEGTVDAQEQTVDARAALPDAMTADARVAVLDCAGGVVPDPVMLAGTMENLIGSGEASGVTLQVFPDGAQKPSQTIVSDLDGLYTLDLPTGGTPWVGEIRTSSDEYIPSHIYPSGLAKSILDLDIPVLTPDARELAGTLAGVTIEETDAIVMAIIIDCNEDEIVGATITTDLASGDQFYLTANAPFLDGDATTTTDSGSAIVLKAAANANTPGKAKVMAAYGGRTWEVTVDVIPGEISFAIFLP